MLGRPGKAGASAAGPVAQGSALGRESATSPIPCARGQNVLALMNRLKTATTNAVSYYSFLGLMFCSGQSDGVWKSWGGWSLCSKTCGTGQKFRSRECFYSDPLCKGTSCSGSAQDAESCNTQCCKFFFCYLFDDSFYQASQTVCGKAGKGGVSAASHVEQDKDPEADLASTLIPPAREPVAMALHKTLKYATPDAVSLA